MSNESPFQSLDLDMIDDGTMEVQQSKPVQNNEVKSTPDSTTSSVSGSASSGPAFAPSNKSQTAPQ